MIGEVRKLTRDKQSIMVEMGQGHRVKNSYAMNLLQLIGLYPMFLLGPTEWVACPPSFIAD